MRYAVLLFCSWEGGHHLRQNPPPEAEPTTIAPGRNGPPPLKRADNRGAGCRVSKRSIILFQSYDFNKHNAK